jgi:hypothetical protein
VVVLAFALGLVAAVFFAGVVLALVAALALVAGAFLRFAAIVSSSWISHEKHAQI